MSKVKQKLIQQGCLSPDGRNEQALFYNVSPDVPSIPNGMTAEEEAQYWREGKVKRLD